MGDPYGIEIDVEDLMQDVKSTAKYALNDIKYKIVEDIDKYVPYGIERQEHTHTSQAGYDNAEIEDGVLTLNYDTGENEAYLENIYFGVTNRGKGMNYVPGRNPKGNPFAGPYWDERAFNDHKLDWENYIIDDIEHKRLLWREQKARQRATKQITIEFK